MLSKRPWIISLAFVIALSAWLASGSIGKDTDKQDTTSAESATKAALASVRVRTVKAEKVDRAIVLYGRTEPTSGGPNSPPPWQVVWPSPPC